MLSWLPGVPVGRWRRPGLGSARPAGPDERIRAGRPPWRSALAVSAIANNLGQLPGHLRQGLLWLLLLGQGLVHRARDGQAGLVVVGDRRARASRVDGLLEHRQVRIAADQALVGVEPGPDRWERSLLQHLPL